MIKSRFILIVSICASCAGSVLGQDSTSISDYDYLVKHRLGFGLIASTVAVGPQLWIYYKGVSFETAYGFPRNSNPKTDVIKETKGSFGANFTLSVASLRSKQPIEGRVLNWPIVVGVGFTRITEKDEVKGYSGSGVIRNLHYFVGIQMLQSNLPIFQRFGGHLYFGYSNWDYSNSILTKNNSELKYNRPSIYGSIAIHYFIK